METTVEAMLIRAARVFHTALSALVPEYQLVCQATPASRGHVPGGLSVLHANIQDEFKECGVHIMSPRHLGDPPEAKLVPPGQQDA